MKKIRHKLYRRYVSGSQKWYSSIYIILLSIFIVWMIFFDTNSYLTHRELNKELSKIKHEKSYYKSKLDSEHAQYTNLKYNKDARERYARENYFFKRKNEDIFIIIQDSNTIKK
ncbi:septum formation initiator family protein [Apibacter muscae]|uniref:FtsB family cell division protein n=1 Tax=Apibacter muscae TaxID=2509004 RepID=UPI0011ABA940|nr:septum formation initiator family protein [Apibacter muscae]TWP22520.1 septum formation initiator family protein [Apibacter muscae]TWP27647.1 septum formation initiator family protein [Apibacter muscae]